MRFKDTYNLRMQRHASITLFAACALYDWKVDHEHSVLQAGQNHQNRRRKKQDSHIHIETSIPATHRCSRMACPLTLGDQGSQHTASPRVSVEGEEDHPSRASYMR